MSARPASGGGRWVEVDPDRLPRWLAGFAERHGSPSVTVEPEGVLRLVAPDGSEAELHAPPGAGRPEGLDASGALDASAAPDPSGALDASAAFDPSAALDAFVVEAGRARRIGLLLARQASVAVGIADGVSLVTSKVDSSYVQGRTAAGGWSQQRFARRRDNQAKAAAAGAADIVARVLLPELARLDAVVTGGDRRTVDVVLSDPRLTAIAARRSARFLDVPEPRHAVLTQAVVRSRSVLIRIRDTTSG